MAITTLIYSDSGKGKTSSIRNLDVNDTLLIQCFDKPLPFKDRGFEKYVISNTARILQKIQSTNKNIIVIDDFTYLMTFNFMNRLNEKGFDKFNILANDIYTLFYNCIYNVPNTKRIYIFGHEENIVVGETVLTKCKTMGKLIDDKINLEGMVTIVLKSVIRNRKYMFSVHNNGFDTVKTPFEMFTENFIDNNLKIVDDTIKEYYNINTSTGDKEESTQDNIQDNIQDSIQDSIQDNIQEPKLKRRPPRNKGEIFLGDVTKGEDIPFDEI